MTDILDRSSNDVSARTGMPARSVTNMLVTLQARSRVGGFFFLDNEETTTSGKRSLPNGAIHVERKILRNVMSSAAEAKAAGLFHNCQTTCSIRTTLEELGYPQPPTIVECDNTTAEGITNDKVKPSPHQSHGHALLVGP